MWFTAEPILPALNMYGSAATGSGLVANITGAKAIGQNEGPAVPGMKDIGRAGTTGTDGIRVTGERTRPASMPGIKKPLTRKSRINGFT
jgi:hypothetical protein